MSTLCRWMGSIHRWRTRTRTDSLGRQAGDSWWFLGISDAVENIAWFRGFSSTFVTFGELSGFQRSINWFSGSSRFIDSLGDFIHAKLVGGWATPLKNMKVNWDDCSQVIWENKTWQPVPTKQQDKMRSPPIMGTSIDFPSHFTFVDLNVTGSSMFILQLVERNIGYFTNMFPHIIYIYIFCK